MLNEGVLEEVSSYEWLESALQHTKIIMEHAIQNVTILSYDKIMYNILEMLDILERF